MESTPGVHLHGDLDPLDLRTSISGSCAASIGSIHLHLSRIPVYVTIPFLKRRRPQLMGVLGGVDLRVSPIDLSVEDMSLSLDGVLGTKGLRGRLDGHVDCETRMRVDGDVKGKVGTFTLALDDEHDGHKHHDKYEHDDDDDYDRPHYREQPEELD
jgi:hypothetical protein